MKAVRRGFVMESGNPFRFRTVSVKVNNGYAPNYLGLADLEWPEYLAATLVKITNAFWVPAKELFDGS